MKWEHGRQKTDYLKFKVFSSNFLLMDLYLLKFPKGSKIPFHRDTVSFGNHYRLNIIVWPFFKGGKFQCEKTIIKIPNFLYLFRSDKYKHGVSKITKGTRYVISFGKVIR